MTQAEQQALLIQYPSGGFGHFIYGLITTCTSGVFCRADIDLQISKSGDSHALQLSVDKWIGLSPNFEFVISDWAKDSPKTHVLLVDSSISNNEFTTVRQRFPSNPIIRMCIDYRAMPIVHQTCEHKAGGATDLDVYSAVTWESREMVSLRYHYADQHPSEFYLRNFKPVVDHNTINIPISWVAYNFELLLDTLEKFIDTKFDRKKTSKIHEEFVNANKKYFMGPIWAERIIESLYTGSNISLTDCTSFYDQGYVNYRIEREFNLKEIPPYTFRDWFKDTDEIRKMLGFIV